MKCSHGDIWEFYNRGFYVVIPTNVGWKMGPVSGMMAVMGRGLALQAKGRHPECAKWLGQEYYKLNKEGKAMGDPAWLKVYPGARIIFLPTKPIDKSAPQYSWRVKSDVEMIKKHLDQLPALATENKLSKIAIPLLGAGNGGLDPGYMKKLISEKLDGDHRFVLVIPLHQQEVNPYVPYGQDQDGPDRARPSL